MGARSGRSSYSLTLHPNFHLGLLVLEERVCLQLCLGGQVSPRIPSVRASWLPWGHNAVAVHVAGCGALQTERWHPGMQCWVVRDLHLNNAESNSNRCEVSCVSTAPSGDTAPRRGAEPQPCLEPARLPPPSPAAILATVTLPPSHRSGEECKEWVHTTLPQHNLQEPSSTFHSQVLGFFEIQVLHMLADATLLCERAETGAAVGLHHSSLCLSPSPDSLFSSLLLKA